VISETGGTDYKVFNALGTASLTAASTNQMISVEGVNCVANVQVTVTVANATVTSATDANWDLFVIQLPPGFNSINPEEEKLAVMLKNLGFKMPSKKIPNRWTIEHESKTGRFADDVKEKEALASPEDLLRYTREELMTWKHRALCLEDEVKAVATAGYATVAGYKPGLGEKWVLETDEPDSPPKKGGMVEKMRRAFSPERPGTLSAAK